MRLLIFAIACNLVACASKPSQADVVLAKMRLDNEARSRARDIKIKTSYTPTPRTAEDDIKASRLARIYYDAVFCSVVALDDGISDPRTIGRAAIGENMDKLIDWKRADTIQFARNPNLKDQVESQLQKLLCEARVNESVSFVLRHRSGKALKKNNERSLPFHHDYQ